MTYIVSVNNKDYKVKIDDSRATERETLYTISVDGKEKALSSSKVNKLNHLSLLLENKSYDINFEIKEEDYNIYVNGEQFSIKVEDERFKQTEKEKNRAKSGPVKIKAPMPGLVVSVEVKEGDSIKEGQSLLILEAMKMQNEIFSPGKGVVKEIKAAKGSTVNSGDILIILE